MEDRTGNAAAATMRPRRSAYTEARTAALHPHFYDRAADEAARDLLGAYIVSEIGGERCASEIVETEAYVGPHDEASHAHVRFGRTERNAAMFGAPGYAYVYLIYGLHWCLNVVTGAEEYPAAVLIRAARPTEGIEIARARRPGRPDRDLMRGPGNLARALGIDGSCNLHPLHRPPLWLEAGVRIADDEIRCGPRVGISRAIDWPLRFWISDSPYVSG